MTDAEMMQQIKTHLGDYIAGAVEGTPFPASLVAAIVANESGGNAAASRFEPVVFGELARVIAGQKSCFEPAGIKVPLLESQLIGAVSPLRPLAKGAPVLPSLTFSQSVLALVNLATSWGPTQIMGWHATEFGYAISDLTNVATHFDRAVELLKWFRQKYSLADDPDDYFHCWNTGSPDGVLFNPLYVISGSVFTQIYEALV